MLAEIECMDTMFEIVGLPEEVEKDNFKKYSVEVKSFEEMYLSPSDQGKELYLAREEARRQKYQEQIRLNNLNKCKKLAEEEQGIDRMIINWVLYSSKLANLSASFSHIILFPNKYRFVPDRSPSENLNCILSLLVIKLARV